MQKGNSEQRLNIFQSFGVTLFIVHTLGNNCYRQQVSLGQTIYFVVHAIFCLLGQQIAQNASKCAFSIGFMYNRYR